MTEWLTDELQDVLELLFATNKVRNALVLIEIKKYIVTIVKATFKCRRINSFNSKCPFSIQSYSFDGTRLKNSFIINDMHQDIPGLWEELGGTLEPPRKMFLSEMWLFGGLRSFWSTSPWKPCVSASLPPFIVDFYWHSKITQRSTRFFQWEL